MCARWSTKLRSRSFWFSAFSPTQNAEKGQENRFSFRLERGKPKAYCFDDRSYTQKSRRFEHWNGFSRSAIEPTIANDHGGASGEQQDFGPGRCEARCRGHVR